ncbi:MAG: hypothetical protein ACRCZG_02520 [Culicoidibacterales bacterium]
MPKLSKIVAAEHAKGAKRNTKNKKGKTPGNYAAMFASMRNDGTYRKKKDPSAKKKK